MRSKFILIILFLSWVGVLTALTPTQSTHAQDSGLPISQTGKQSTAPTIAISPEGTVHIAWEQEDGIWYRRVQHGMLTPLEQISAEGKNPVLAVDPYGEIAYLAWEQEFSGNYEIFTRKWDAQQGWAAPHNVSNNAGGSTSPTLAVSSLGIVHLLWSDTTPGDSTLYHAVSANGESWPESMPINSAHGSNPSAAIDAQGILYVAWQNRTSFAENLRIWTMHKADNAWSTPTALTDGSTQAYSAQISSQNNQTRMVWQEGAQSILALRKDESWQRIRLQAGASPAVAITEQGTVEWAWKNAQGLVREHNRAQTWQAISWGTPENSHVTLFAQATQIGIAWVEDKASGSQIFYTHDIPATLYLPTYSHIVAINQS